MVTTAMAAGTWEERQKNCCTTQGHKTEVPDNNSGSLGKVSVAEKREAICFKF